jgi:alpha-galactosidase
MWCLLAAPLIAGNDLRNMTTETRKILTNREVIAIDQDSSGIQGFRHSMSDSMEIWFKPLAGGDWAMGVLNRSKALEKFTFKWEEEKVSDSFSGRELQTARNQFRIKNLWTNKELGTTKKMLIGEVPGHDVLLLRLTIM